MKRKKNLLIALLLVLIPVFAIGYQYFFDDDNLNVSGNHTLTVEGGFTQESLPGKTDLVPGDTICDNISLDITSTAESVLRVKLEATSDGSDISDKLEVILKDNEKWIKDGAYYYYKEKISVTSGNVENIQFIDKVVFNGDNNDQNKDIDLNFEMDLVQYKYDAYATKWEIGEGNLVYEHFKSLE